MRHFVRAALAVLLFGTGSAVAQDKPAPPPPNTKIEGMPPIPQSIVDAFGRYAQNRAARMVAWHPSKRQMLVSTSFSTSPVIPQLHLVDGPGRDRRQLTWYPAPGLPLGNAWFDPADGNTFVFPFDPGGTELRSIYRYDLTTGELSLVTDAKMRYSPAWSRQGKWLAYDSLERNGKDRDLYVIQPSDPRTKRRLADFTGAYSPHDWSPDGTAILANEVVGNNETYLWRVDVKTGEKKAITPREGGEKVGFFNARFSSDGRKVYAVSNRAGDDWRIWRCDVANCVWSAVTPEGIALPNPNGANGGFELSPDGTLLAASVDRGTHTELLILDVTALKPRALPAMPLGSVGQIRWRPGSREVGFTLSSVKSPGDAYSIDTSLGTLTRWTSSETTFNSDVLPPPEIVQWKSFDGLPISGVLYKPAQKFTGPRPVFVSIHGGPEQNEGPRWMGRSNYLLNEIGVAILYPNMRGSSGFGKKFASLDDGKLRGDVVKDIGALLDWIPSRPDLDKSRVVLVGISSGGWLALQAGAQYNDRIRGVIEGAGMTNIVTFLEQTDPARQENRRLEYGDERDPQTRAFLESLSPINHAAELKKPTFIIHPGKDARVPVNQAQDLVKALRANNKDVWYMELDANHDNMPAVGGDYMLAAWVVFLRAFVLN